MASIYGSMGRHSRGVCLALGIPVESNGVSVLGIVFGRRPGFDKVSIWEPDVRIRGLHE